VTRQWSKFDERGLARFVLPQAARWIRLPFNRADVLTQPDGRRKLVEAIYTTLLDSGIRYAPEQYHPELAEQVIRSPSEILSSPGEGTCLDLATLFAGICLGFELLPVVIVTETHALCAVSLTHGAPDWDSFDRTERHSFEQPVTDAAVLTGSIDSGSFLAVECTGFAHSQSMPVDSIEGAGRRDGILSFLDATAAGRRQLERPDSPLRFAIDMAVAQYHWKILPPILPAGHELATEELVAEQVAAGLRLDKAARSFEIRPYPRPVSPLLRPALGFVDREKETATLLDGVNKDGVAWLTGLAGVGKTALLRHLAHGDRSSHYQDGVIYLSHMKNRMDGAQQAFDAFYDSPPEYKPSISRIGQSLRTLQALVMVDDSTTSASDGLADLMPTSHVVAVPDEGTPGAGPIVTLGTLADEDATALFAQNLGRAVGPGEQDKVRELCRSLNGHPARIIDAARTVAAGTATIEVLLESSRLSTDGPSRSRYARLEDTDRHIVDLLEIFKDSGLLGRHIDALVPGEVEPAVSRLVTDRAVATSSPRYRLAATAMGAVVDVARVESGKQKAITYFEEWVLRASPEELGESLPEILQVMSWASDEQRWKTVVSMGTTVETVASLTRLWGLWGSILETTRTAAVQLGDRSAEAYTLHQLGSRARLLGDRNSARSYLRQARRIRRELGDTAGARLSTHNLRLTGLGWIPWAVGMVLLAAIGAGVVCATTNLCETDGPVGPSAPRVVLSPEEIDFGETPVGAGIVEFVEISNQGDEGATIGEASIEGDDGFAISGTDCPEFLEAGGRCQYTLAFTPGQEGPHNATFGLDVADADRISIRLSGSALAPADVTLDPGVGEFGEVPVGEQSERIFVLDNQGEQPAAITDGPVVDGEYFSLQSTDCTVSLGPGDSCQINVLFTPDRDPDAGVDNQIHEGVLSVETDSSGNLEAPLQGVSTFLLPDLTIDLHEATLIGREVVSQTDMVVIRTVATIRNSGTGPAAGFRVTGEEGSEGVWVFTPYTEDPTSFNSDATIEETLSPGQELSIDGFMLVPRSSLSGGEALPVRLLVDSCAGEEFVADQCRVLESNEENNYSPEADANPTVGSTEVELERDLPTLGSGDSNTANLVADALAYYGLIVAEEQGGPSPVAAIVATRAMLPPLFDPGESIGPGDLHVLQLIDIVPRGRAVSIETDDAEGLRTTFEDGAAQAPTEDFVHVSDGSHYFICSNGGQLNSLILGDRTVVSGYLPQQIEILPLIVTDLPAQKLGFPAADPEGLPLWEILQMYLRDGLGGVVQDQQYPEGGTTRYEEDTCVD